MLSYRDRAFCASPNCSGACGRQITEEQKAEAIKVDLPIAWGYFCDIPEDAYNSIKDNESPE